MPNSPERRAHSPLHRAARQGRGSHERPLGFGAGLVVRGVVVLLLLALGAPTTRADDAEAVFEDGHTGELVRIPASTLPASDPPSRSRPGTAPRTAADASLETPEPTEWQPRVMRCRRYRRKRYCEGPRRVPVPFGSAAERATRLGLGGRRGAARVKDRTPPPEWVAEVEGEAHESLAFPVDGGRMGRGLSRARGRRHPVHEGVDIMAAVGARVRSVDDGLVVYADNELTGYGNVLLVLHRDGTVALYAHLRAAYVFEGQSVRQGQVIGEVGETGLARGSHLHFELRRDGRPENPVPRLVRPNGSRPGPEAGSSAANTEAEFTPAS